MKTFTAWQPLISTAPRTTPDRPGVFQLATLVRTVVYIGAAPDLAAALAQHVSLAGSQYSLGRRYFRFVETEHPEQVQQQLLEDFRRTHRGTLPSAQAVLPSQPPAQRLLNAGHR